MKLPGSRQEDTFSSQPVLYETNSWHEPGSASEREFQQLARKFMDALDRASGNSKHESEMRFKPLLPNDCRVSQPFGFRLPLHQGQQLVPILSELICDPDPANEWDWEGHLYTDDGNIADFYFTNKSRMIEIYTRFNHT